MEDTKTTTTITTTTTTAGAAGTVTGAAGELVLWLQRQPYLQYTRALAAVARVFSE